ncbi:MAG: Integral membrane sensor signal transduction histidine kinase [Candidatus Moranbacteria bacterium GW2011_GWE1_35_17]|nr:MAG: Integral membrane sensor signal transduction histidine kinase [Candidatus Moranbacteria bacterium GW2011_GWE1_35_17]KKP84027.1 MAG: Integral membrane sensor signal transduction histidine kinase [Candidatus Moranbacteria bacterium GW2011_GWF1_35_5]
MNLNGESLRKLMFPFVIISSCLTLYLTSLYNYLLFHSLVELSTVVISFGIFVVAWSSRHYINNIFLLILGIGYFFIGSVDLLHTLSYGGMQIFYGYDKNLPTQLWIVGRYIEALTFIGALIFFKRRLAQNHEIALAKFNLIFLFYFGISLFIILSTFYWKNFPDAYIEGVGLTQFKKNSEYIISLLFLFATILIFKKSKLIDSKMVNLLSLALMFKIVSELLFTEYVGIHDFSNMLGHLLKFISFLLLYRAILEIGLMRPYQFLFVNSKKSQEEYRLAQNEMQKRVEEDIIELYRHAGISNRKMSLLLEMEEQSKYNKDRQGVIKHIVNSLKGAFHADVVLLYRHKKGYQFSLVLGEGVNINVRPDLIDVSPQEAIFIKSLMEEKKRISFSCDSALAGCFKDGSNLEYCVATPLVQKNICVGFLLIGFKKYKKVDKQGLEFLDIFSIHIVSAMVRLQLIKKD